MYFWVILTPVIGAHLGPETCGLVGWNAQWRSQILSWCLVTRVGIFWLPTDRRLCQHKEESDTGVGLLYGPYDNVSCVIFSALGKV